MGAPNVDAFLPCNQSSHPCIVKVADFQTPRDLAQHIATVAADPTLYNQYHAWRQFGLSDSFVDMFHYTFHSLPCRVCEKVAEMQYEDSLKEGASAKLDQK
jgi:hypothetical protein